MVYVLLYYTVEPPPRTMPESRHLSINQPPQLKSSVILFQKIVQSEFKALWPELSVVVTCILGTLICINSNQVTS